MGCEVAQKNKSNNESKPGMIMIPLKWALKMDSQNIVAMCTNRRNTNVNIFYYKFRKG